MTEAKKKYHCSRCNKIFDETKFYTYRDGSKVEICKDCLCAYVNNLEPNSFIWKELKMNGRSKKEISLFQMQ